MFAHPPPFALHLQRCTRTPPFKYIIITLTVTIRTLNLKTRMGVALAACLLWRWAQAEDMMSIAVRYLVHGATPVSKTLSVEGVLDALDYVGQAVREGTIEPHIGIDAAERAAGLNCCNEAAGALLNNLALRCGAIYSESAECDRGETFAKAFNVSGGTAGITLNYAYFLEQRDQPEAAARVLSDSPSTAIGLRVAAASLCPPHGKYSEELAGRYASLVARLEALASELERWPNRTEDAATMVGFMPIAWPYLGYAFAPLATALGRIYKATTPIYVRREVRALPRKLLRVAVVAELGRNTSPGMLFELIFEGLCEMFQVILVAPSDLDTPFLHRARPLAYRIVSTTREEIADLEPDCVLFLAVGLSPITYALALARLAPVQIVFGHGHPITSGLADTIDYFVSSDDFVLQFEPPLHQNDTSILSPAEYDALAAAAARLPPPVLDPQIGPRSTDGVQRYAEQLVLFDSRTIGMRPPPPPEAVATPQSPFFACLQHSKKLHPDFDDAIDAVLRAVPDATIALLEGTKTHLPRWTRRGIDVSRLHFVPRDSRERILGIVSRADACLDTYPWGGGVTVLESLALCTPTIILPSRTSVLQLALGHLKAIDLHRHLVARDVEHYASIARRLAKDHAFRQYVSHRACQRTDRLFDHAAALAEWSSFIERAVKSASHTVSA